MAIWLSFATVVLGSIAQFAISYTTGDINKHLTKAHNAEKSTHADAVSGHKKVPKVDAKVIPRDEESPFEVLAQIGYNLVWTFYLSTVVKKYAKQASE